MSQSIKKETLSILEKKLEFLSFCLYRFAQVSCFLILLTITVIILMEITFRKFPIINVSWAEESVKMLAVWLGLFAASVALKQGSHIGMNYLVQKISSFRLAMGFSLIVKFSIAYFLGLAVVYGSILSKEVGIQTSPGLQISMTWAYLSVPCGSLLMLMQILYLIMVDINDFRRGKRRLLKSEKS